ncbi:PepSY domain-containing protein [Salibacterium lacus]|uniref:PepSY domain-containing protein n=1 Tax=Salibacterium lacus TaxID=1898109 RepID=A0ABW5SXI3_9BACI
MKRRLLLTGLALILTAGLFYLGYTIIRSPLAETLDEAENIVLAEDHVESVQESFYYHGNETVHSVSAELSNGSKEWFFLKEGSIILRLPAEDSISSSEAEEIVLNRFNRQHVRSIKPGLENGNPLYEVTFEDDNSLYYYYLSMENGDYIKRYSIQKSG